MKNSYKLALYSTAMLCILTCTLKAQLDETIRDSKTGQIIRYGDIIVLQNTDNNSYIKNVINPLFSQPVFSQSVYATTNSKYAGFIVYAKNKNLAQNGTQIVDGDIIMLESALHPTVFLFAESGVKLTSNISKHNLANWVITKTPENTISLSPAKTVDQKFCPECTCTTPNTPIRKCNYENMLCSFKHSNCPLYKLRFLQNTGNLRKSTVIELVSLSDSWASARNIQWQQENTFDDHNYTSSHWNIIKID